MKPEHYSGNLTPEINPFEAEHEALCRKAGAEGIVMLENHGVLPIIKGGKIALYGAGARHPIKGGMGSGDVNERKTMSVYDGLLEKGYVICSNRWLDDYDEAYQDARLDWRKRIQATTLDFDGDLSGGYINIPFYSPAGRPLDDIDIKEADTDTAVYVITRRSGEFVDRLAKHGDYYLSEEESSFIMRLDELFSKVVLVINAGGTISLSFTEKMAHLSALLYMSQPGMSAGGALADIISGDVTPSGKLTDTWALEYGDYPSSAHFSHNDGDVEKAIYDEDIYVGYRYFDSFGVIPRYEFGYGMSYTSFRISSKAFDFKDDILSVTVEVTNIGRFSGKETIQLYTALPSTGIYKEHKRLSAFAKTKLLAPGECQKVKLSLNIKSCASYHEDRAKYVLEKGDYTVLVGNSSRNYTPVLKFIIMNDTATENLKNLCGTPSCKISPLIPNRSTMNYEMLPIVNVNMGEIQTDSVIYEEKARENDHSDIIKELSDNELCRLVCGMLSDGGGSVGQTEGRVPGTAGETESLLKERFGLDGIVFADGPAGLRLQQVYHTAPNGSVKLDKWVDTVEKGFFCKEPPEGYTPHYQYATAFPIGTCLAQTWNTELVKEIGEAVSKEMDFFGISVWLAPGMNIHRDPLCGRNFEYYSEDPLVSGKIAAAMTNGVQKSGRHAVTVKHFCCNNQEENRQHCDSVIFERALREIYLKGFEICVRESQPLCLMTSYNLLNGIHTANRYDLLNDILRCEWGYKGLVMTDWWTTGWGGSISYKCIDTGNDLIMPGTPDDLKDVEEALADGRLSRKHLNTCAARVIDLIEKCQCKK